MVNRGAHVGAPADDLVFVNTLLEPAADKSDPDCGLSSTYTQSAANFFPGTIHSSFRRAGLPGAAFLFCARYRQA